MSRIRSIHPGLWTDEDFVSLSSFSRLLLMGLWNECDDKGIFEWKPVTLKMRILPADSVDVAAMLDEISAAGLIRRYEIDGKPYGAVKNFGKFQRPKKPNDIFPATAEILAFCSVSSEPVPHQFPTSSEIAKQMEDGGDKGREEKNNKGDFAFAGAVIRLRRDDFSRWSKAYSDLDLRAVLQARDDWLNTQPEPERKRWFNSTSNFLAKKQQEARTAKKSEAVFSGPC